MKGVGRETGNANEMKKNPLYVNDIRVSPKTSEHYQW